MDILHKQRVEHHKKYMINYKDIEHYDLKVLFPLGCTFVCDTESSFKYENKGIPIKIDKKVIETEVDEKGNLVRKEKIKKVINPDFDTEVHVYAWAVACDFTDFCVYGENLNDMFNLFNDIAFANLPDKMPKTEKGYRKIKRDLKFRCFVHNLGWDVEFMKYTLNDRQINYQLSKINKKSKKKLRVKQEPCNFNIVENNNIVYSCYVGLENISEVVVKKQIENITTVDRLPVFCEVEFLDSYKIQSAPLEDIAKNVVKIDECFLKMSESYDYEKVRTVGHELTELEKHYLYNDVYILKEWVNQFYKKLGTNCVTSSAIAFEKYIDITYGDKGYKGFLENYPDLSDYEYIWSIVKKSYSGGWTQANRKYRNLVVTCNGVSIDINSSYPSSVAYRLLPYGMPVLHNGKYECLPDKELAIYTIHFDGFKNINDDDLIGKIQVGAMSSVEFGLNGTEYIDTNIKEYKVVGDELHECDLIGTNAESETHRYAMSFWNFELENLLESMDFYEEVKKYDPIRDFSYSTGVLKKGFYIENSLVFKAKYGEFRKAVEHFNEMKIEGKIIGDKVKEGTGKLSNNGFYGKLASNYVRLERKLYFDDEGMAQFETTDNVYNAERKYYPPFASAVTAWSRVNLRTTLYKVGYNNVLYFDTDSLYTTLSPEEIKERCGDILDKTELGKWDIEKEYTKFKSLGAKKYILYGRDYVEPEKIVRVDNEGNEYIMKKGKEVKRSKPELICKCAGLPKEVRKKQTFETFKIGATFTGKKVRTKCKGGFALIEGEFKIHQNSYF